MDDDEEGEEEGNVDWEGVRRAADEDRQVDEDQKERGRKRERENNPKIGKWIEQNECKGEQEEREDLSLTKAKRKKKKKNSNSFLFF